MDVGSLTYYSISPRMLDLLGMVHERLGEAHARHLHSPPPELEKAYLVSTVHATLALEGSELDPLPLARLVDQRAAATTGPAALEAVNTHRVYGLLAGLDPFAEQDLRHAHAVLMHGLAMDAGHYRTGSLEVFYGEPQPLRTATAHDLPVHVQELLRFAEEDEFPPLFTAAVVHFGLVYLRPFTAGNGRLARLWQRRLLLRHWPVFAYLPVEAFINRTQPAYYAALEYADRRGDCGNFVTYVLERIHEALAELLAAPDPVRHAPDRMAVFLSQQAAGKPFRRKDYRSFFPKLSTATATRDLREAVKARRITLEGTGRTAVYLMRPKG